jgi:hypothetical protein
VERWRASRASCVRWTTATAAVPAVMPSSPKSPGRSTPRLPLRRGGSAPPAPGARRPAQPGRVDLVRCRAVLAGAAALRPRPGAGQSCRRCLAGGQRALPDGTAPLASWHVEGGPAPLPARSDRGPGLRLDPPTARSAGSGR